MEAYYRPFTTMGWILIICGALLVLLPVISRSLPNIDRIPWFILWVYRRDGFYFATSPLLIALSVASILLQFFSRR